MRSWQTTLGHEVTITVNLSPRQVSEPTLVQEVGAALSESGLPACSLVLEITPLEVPEAEALLRGAALKQL